MKRDELLALATKAGVVPVNRAHPHLEPIWWSVTAEDLERFAALVAAQEREACATVCDGLVYALDGGGNQYRRPAPADQCAAKIRARSNE